MCRLYSIYIGYIHTIHYGLHNINLFLHTPKDASYVPTCVIEVSKSPVVPQISFILVTHTSQVNAHLQASQCHLEASPTPVMKYTRLIVPPASYTHTHTSASYTHTRLQATYMPMPSASYALARAVSKLRTRPCRQQATHSPVPLIHAHATSYGLARAPHTSFSHAQGTLDGLYNRC